MEKSQIWCSIHQKEIIYICFNSAWHCELMCCDCLPGHSEIHVKNNTVSKIESFDNFMKIHKDNIMNTMTFYDDFINEFQLFDKKEGEILYDSNEELKKLRIIRMRLHDKIDEKLMEIESFLQNKINEKHKTQKSKIEKVDKEVRSLKKHLEKHLEIVKLEKDNDKLKESLKLSSKFANTNDRKNEIMIYKDLLSIEIDHVLQIDEGILEDFFSKTFDSIIHISENVLQNSEKKEQTKKIKNKEKNQPSKKLCKNCGQEMEYVSEFKKHLVCNNCSSVKRLYEKKKI